FRRVLFRSGRLQQPRRRLPHDPPGDPLRRPGDLLRAEAPVLGQGAGRPRRRAGPAARQGPGGTARHRRHPARLRPDGAHLPGGRGRRRGGRPLPGGDRPAVALPARHRPGGRVGAAHRAVCGGARGAGVLRVRGRARRPGHRAVLLPPGGPGAAGGRLRHAVSAVPARGPLPARPRPGARRRRPYVRLLTGEGPVLREFKLPDVGEGLTEAEIVRWHVAPGDPVRVNQTIVEIETAKAVVELPCPFEGVVAGLLAAEGDTVEVGTPIIQVETEPDAAPAPGGGADARQGAPAPAAAEEPRAVAETGGAASGEAAEEETGGRRPVLVGYGVKVGATRRRPRRPGPGRGPAGTAPAAPSFPGTQAAPPVRPAAPAAPGRITTLAKPPVRKLAKDLGVDLATVTGTGPNGTITREDVRRAAAGTAPAAPVAPAAPQAAPREERIPVKGVRKAMATAMVASAFSVPHVTEFLQVDVTATVDAVARLRAMPDF